MTTFLDWRTEPEADMAENVIAYVRPAAMCKDGKPKYRVECFADGCKWEELYDYYEYSDDDIEEIRQSHIRWHDEGCQP